MGSLIISEGGLVLAALLFSVHAYRKTLKMKKRALQRRRRRLQRERREAAMFIESIKRLDVANDFAAECNKKPPLRKATGLFSDAAAQRIYGTDNTGTEVKQNGESADIRGNRAEAETERTVDTWRKTDTNGEPIVKTQAKGNTTQVQKRASGAYDTESELLRGRESRVESRTLKDVCGTDKFSGLAEYVSREISKDASDKLFEKYRNDPRLDDGEYFDGESLTTAQDIAGATVSAATLEGTQ